MSDLEPVDIAEEENGRKDHGPWPVTLGPNQEVIGLPEGIKPENVLLRLRNYGSGIKPGWEAVNPLPKDTSERNEWRGDMTA